MLISHEQWRFIEPLLARALELSPEAREGWLAELSGTQPDVLPILRALLSADVLAEQSRYMETLPPMAGVDSDRLSPWSADVRLGQYLLVKQLGRGGMGEVWLARQDRDGIRRDVALKLPMLIGHVDHWRERFRRERDILARLQHPHIATLYDAGLASAPGGAQQPYLAMEYVEGCGLLEYAAQHSLNLRDRLELFRQVLSAVASAHQKLIVHRDLKPANILVGGDGQVKLLDFGIAKLLHGAGPGLVEDELTRQAGRLLTMRYAAPEQLTDAPPTTATDVYALGIILHELLTGQSPYLNVREGRSLTQVDLLQAVIAPPSQSSGDRALRGDLDAILLKCLRVDPADRYSSVEQFEDDLRRFLERRPVLARKGDGRYRLGRFFVRYRLPLAVAAVTVFSLLTGLFVALEQRHQALVARANAERHFASVRELANTFIRDIEKDLRPIPGTLAIRERLAQTSIRYLDRLAAEGVGDPALALEVAQGYRHLGEVMGGLDGNQGRWSEAMATLQKAARLLDVLDVTGPRGREALEEREQLYFLLAVQYDQNNDLRMLDALDHSNADLRTLMRMRGSPPEDVATLATRLIEVANARTIAGAAGPRQITNYPQVAEAASLLQELRSRPALDFKSRDFMANAYLHLSEVLTANAETQAERLAALAASDTAVEMSAALSRESNGARESVRLTAYASGRRAEPLMSLGRFAEAEQAIEPFLKDLASLYELDKTEMDVAASYWGGMALGAEVAYRAGLTDVARQRVLAAESVWARLTDPVRSSGGAMPFRDKLDYFGGLALLGGNKDEHRDGCQRLRALQARLPTRSRRAPGEFNDPQRFSELRPAIAACDAVPPGRG